MATSLRVTAAAVKDW